MRVRRLNYPPNSTDNNLILKNCLSFNYQARFQLLKRLRSCMRDADQMTSRLYLITAIEKLDLSCKIPAWWRYLIQKRVMKIRLMPRIFKIRGKSTRLLTQLWLKPKISNLISIRSKIYQLKTYWEIVRTARFCWISQVNLFLKYFLNY